MKSSTYTGAIEPFCQRSLAFKPTQGHNFHMRFFPIIAFAFFCFPAQADDLTTAVQQALSSHPSIQAAQRGLEAGRLQTEAEESSLYPTVSLSGSGGRIYGDNSTSRGLAVTRGSGYSWLWEGSASLSQTLFDWSARDERINRAVALQGRDRFGLEDTKEATAYRAVQAYIAVAAAREAMDLMEMQKKELQDMRERIEIAVTEGGGDESEISRADDLILLADNALANAAAREATAIANYQEAVGGKVPESMDMPEMPKHGLPKTVSVAVSTAIEDHPQLEATRMQAQSFHHEAEAESAAGLPRLEGQLSYLKRDQRDVIGGEATDARAVLNLNWDIETGGGVSSRRDRARALSSQAAAEEQAVRVGLERDIRTAWAGYELAGQQIDIQTRRVESAQAVMETYQDQFEAAQRSLLEIMQVTNQTYEARLARVDAYYAQIDAAYTVLAAMGVLRETLKLDS